MEDATRCKPPEVVRESKSSRDSEDADLNRRKVPDDGACIDGEEGVELPFLVG